MQFGVENHGMYHPRSIFDLGDFNAFCPAKQYPSSKTKCYFCMIKSNEEF